MRMRTLALVILALGALPPGGRAAAGEGPGLPWEPARNVKVVCDRWPDASGLRQFALDAVRLAAAKTEPEQALAVFRWMRRVTMFTNGTAPSERGNAVLDELKILNVYGAHWCDGRALCMENLWRSLGGRAYKLYVPEGYTMALVHWTDADGVGRWHQVHASRGWYVYDRPGKLVAGPDDIGADFSLMFRPSRTGIPRTGHPPRPWNWIAVGHRAMSSHDTSLDLRRGESYARLWGNEGLPACDNIGKEQYDDGEHGPYPITYGNGRLVSRLDPAAPGLITNQGDAFQVDWPVRLPHVLADAWLEGALPEGLTARLSFDGQSWSDVGGPRGGRLELGRAAKGPASVVGRYKYVLRLSWKSKKRPEESKELPALVNVVQQNLFALPQLWPGKNRITVTADQVPAGTALRVTYEWDDAGGKGKRSVAVVEQPPYSYEIAAGGARWTDVVCRKLTVEAVAASGQGNRVEVREPQAQFEPRPPEPATDDIVGDKKPPALRKTAEYLAELKDPARRVEALDALMVLGDPAAADALTELLYSEENLEVQVRGRVAQAVFHSLPAKAAFARLLPVVRREDQVKWAAASGGENWRSVASLVAHLAATANCREAIPDLVAAYKRGVGMWNRPTFLRAFGRLKAAQAVPLCVEALRQPSDVSASAAWALGELGDASAAPRIVENVEGRLGLVRHEAILYAESAAALGKLKAGSPEALKLLEKLLAHADEEVRGEAARALGMVGGARHAALLESAAEKEAFPWVKSRMLEAAGRLKAAGK